MSRKLLTSGFIFRSYGILNPRVNSRARAREFDWAICAGLRSRSSARDAAKRSRAAARATSLRSRRTTCRDADDFRIPASSIGRDFVTLIQQKSACQSTSGAFQYFDLTRCPNLNQSLSFAFGGVFLLYAIHEHRHCDDVFDVSHCWTPCH